ncbi:hypothetical protein H072_10752 [Dactylellina haptotyla CBS 200.50]|uniref:Uncharacterized protein n=1 Tax=Dactylellina haptotyla (strain CBS 200.50) TaxID=1284197 RepID=S8A3U3_DACHA|nr:hypothetical protein H072_10752 [Dactylellina haptotyla CBS 200.50]
MSHLPNELFDPTARAPREANQFYKSLQDHRTKYRLRKLASSNTFRKVKIPRSERTPSNHIPAEQRMQGLRRDTAEANIRRVKRQAARKVHSATVRIHKYIRASQELRQRILHARDETVDLLIPLFEELGTEPSAVLQARKLAAKLDRRIGRFEYKIARVENKITFYQRKILETNTAKEGKIAAYETHIKNLTRRTQVSGTEGSGDGQAGANLRKSAELWLHTHLNRHTRSCASFDRPLHRSKSRRGSTAEGVRVRWSGDLLVSDSVTIRPTESGASGEISRSTSGDSLSSSIVNIDAVLAIPAEAIAEGLELDLKVIKREPQPRQFDPKDIVVVDEISTDRQVEEVVQKENKGTEEGSERQGASTDPKTERLPEEASGTTKEEQREAETTSEKASQERSQADSERERRVSFSDR